MKVACLALAALLLLRSAIPKTPAAAHAGLPLASVRIEIEGRQSDEPALVELVETRVGAPLSLEAVRESIAHLYSLRRFENVEVHAESAGLASPCATTSYRSTRSSESSFEAISG